MILKWVDNYVKKHIYGDAISDVFKLIGKKERRQKKLLKQQPKNLFILLLLRLVSMLAKKQAIKLFSY